MSGHLHFGFWDLSPCILILYPVIHVLFVFRQALSSCKWYHRIFSKRIKRRCCQWLKLANRAQSNRKQILLRPYSFSTTLTASITWSWMALGAATTPVLAAKVLPLLKSNREP